MLVAKIYLVNGLSHPILNPYIPPCRAHMTGSPVTYGVLQGSELYNILFIKCVSYISELNNWMSIVHVDAISVLSGGMNSEQLWKNGVVNIGKVTQYSDGNKLYTNFLKSRF
jgi:hypothetical protein